jgi:DNA-binding transcriptional MerR regulator
MKDSRLSIGRVSQMVQLPTSVLRYWESVFDQLKPEKTPGGTRKYTMQDVQEIFKIKDLLYNKKFTIAGAKIELKHTPTVTFTGDEQSWRNYVIKELEDMISDLDHWEEKPRRKQK